MSKAKEYRLASLLTPQHWPTWLGLGILRVLIMLPYSAQISIGKAIGRLAGKLIPSRRRVIATNIRHCLPKLTEDEVQELAVQHLEAVGMSVLETGLSWWANEQQLTKLLDQTTGLENLEKAQATEQGILFLTAHFTQMELGARLQSLYMNFAPVYRRLNNPVVEYVNHKAHNRNATEAIANDNIKRLVGLLRKGESAWIAPDQQHKGRNSEIVDFFGQPAHSATVTSTIAKLSKAIVIPVFYGRTERGYCIDFLPPLENFPSGDNAADTLRYHHLIEQQVLKYPDQYLWVHKRFKGVEGFSYD